MRAIVMPVKDLTRAKQRLAGLLGQEVRTALARAMLEDVFTAVAAARGVDAVFVISSDAPALARARALGWETFIEHRQISESHSVDAASRLCQAGGVGTLLRLPIDIPLVESRDIEALFHGAAACPSVVMVPSRDGAGTNALLRTPPGLFPSHFGPGSLARHLDEAGRAGAHVQVIRNSRIELDIDDEADLRFFLSVRDRESATAACLRRLGVDLSAESRPVVQAAVAER